MARLNQFGLKLVRFVVLACKRQAAAFMILIAAVLATPSWLDWREQSKAAESHRYLACVQQAQDRYHAIHRQYAQNVRDLDMVRPEPTFFAVGEVTAGSTGSLADSWSLTLTRFGDAFLFGSYTVTFHENGFDAASSTIDKGLIAIALTVPSSVELASR